MSLITSLLSFFISTVCFAFLLQFILEGLIKKLQTENELQTQKQVIKFELNSFDECLDGSFISCFGNIYFGAIVIFFFLETPWEDAKEN